MESISYTRRSVWLLRVEKGALASRPSRSWFLFSCWGL